MLASAELLRQPIRDDLVGLRARRRERRRAVLLLVARLKKSAAYLKLGGCSL